MRKGVERKRARAMKEMRSALGRAKVALRKTCWNVSGYGKLQDEECIIVRGERCQQRWNGKRDRAMQKGECCSQEERGRSLEEGGCIREERANERAALFVAVAGLSHHLRLSTSIPVYSLCAMARLSFTSINEKLDDKPTVSHYQREPLNGWPWFPPLPRLPRSILRSTIG